MRDASAAVRAAMRLLRERYGLETAPHRVARLASELELIGSAGGAEAAIERLLNGDEVASERLVAAMTVPESYFFRHPGHFESLTRIARGSTRPLMVLSAGCAGGEEAWSAAAALAWARPEADDRVVGWDVCEARLRDARSGRYRHWSVRAGVDRYGAWLRPADGGWEVAPALRQRVVFSRVNLVGSLPVAGPFDVILFRNVAIYWDAATSCAAMDQLAALLRPGGVLMVGPSDPGAPDPSRWEHVIESGGRVFRRAGERSVATVSHASERAVHSEPRVDAPPAGARSHADRVMAAPTTAAPPRNAPVAPRSAADDALASVARLADDGRYAEALELIRRRGIEDVDALRWEGLLLLNLDDPARAVEMFRRCVFVEPARTEHRHWLAIAYRAAGRIEDAQRELRNLAREVER